MIESLLSSRIIYAMTGDPMMMMSFASVQVMNYGTTFQQWLSYVAPGPVPTSPVPK